MTTLVSEAELRDFLAGLLVELDLQAPLDAFEVAERVGVLLGRPLVVRNAEFPTANASGVAIRLADPDRYMIGLQQAATAGHRAHVLFHEIVHVVRGHLDGPGGDGEDDAPIACRSLGEAGTAQAAAAAGAQGSLVAAREWEAEIGATILSGWSRSNPGRAAQVGDDPAARRLASALMGAPWT